MSKNIEVVILSLCSDANVVHFISFCYKNSAMQLQESLYTTHIYFDDVLRIVVLLIRMELLHIALTVRRLISQRDWWTNRAKMYRTRDVSDAITYGLSDVKLTAFSSI